MTIDQIMRLIHTYMGECWHEWDWKPIEESGSPYICLKCGKRAREIIPPPDYSTPEHFRTFTAKLFKDEMWKATWGFYWFLRDKWSSESKLILTHATNMDFIPWILNEERFCKLFAEFLRLPETVEEFGMIDCKKDGSQPCIYADKDNVVPLNISCDICDGKVLKPWAKMVKELGHG